MRKPTVPQSRIDRAIKALKAQGEKIGGVELQADGSVRILTGEPQALLDPVEQWRAENGHRAFTRS